MSDAIRHRGPDSEGFFSAPGVGLGIRRLAIIDVRGGDQPISNEDGSIWIVLNGEIYNYPEMRVELEKRGHHFKTKTDTECILHYYEDEGDACVQRLRGMFAFALWDTKKRRLLIARDRLGKKPVYYTVRDGSLYFCSELDGLLQGLPVAARGGPGGDRSVSEPAIHPGAPDGLRRHPQAGGGPHSGLGGRQSHHKPVLGLHVRAETDRQRRAIWRPSCGSGCAKPSRCG